MKYKYTANTAVKLKHKISNPFVWNQKPIKKCIYFSLQLISYNFKNTTHLVNIYSWPSLFSYNIYGFPIDGLMAIPQ